MQIHSQCSALGAVTYLWTEMASQEGYLLLSQFRCKLAKKIQPSRVVSHAGAMTFQIQITKTYNTSNLLEDIKGLYKLTGLKGQKVAFIFT